MLPPIKAGQLKALANCALKRSPILPDVLTVQEQGLSGYEVTGWWGILAPAGTPAPIVNKLSSEIKVVVSSAPFLKLLDAEGSEPEYLGPNDFGKFVREEIEKWQQVVKAAKIEKIKQ